jgi:hypothetical protein
LTFVGPISICGSKIFETLLSANAKHNQMVKVHPQQLSFTKPIPIQFINCVCHVLSHFILLAFPIYAKFPVFATMKIGFIHKPQLTIHYNL